MTTATNADPFSRLDDLQAGLESLYRDLHAHPELAFEEHRTAGVIAERLGDLGYEVTTGVGRTGVVGVLRNGDGPTVLLRADFDALPVREQTGLPYASTATGVDRDGSTVPVMHACGHDSHVTCLLGALDLLAGSRSTWKGTVLAVFQPAEEIGAGARAMVDDGLFTRFDKPEIVLGQHVAPLPSGMLGAHPGTAFAAADALQVRIIGKGAHGSRPETGIDPVVIAAATVLRLQTVVSREIAGVDTAVVTVGALNAGTKDNVIPEEAILKLNIRTLDESVRKTVLTAVERIVKHEAEAGGVEQDPEITPLDSFPLLANDPEATATTVEAFKARFGDQWVIDPGSGTGSEDCGILATASGARCCFWYFGGADPDQFAAAAAAGTVDRTIPANHSPHFAPVLQPTLRTGVEAMTTAAVTWLDER